LISRLLADLVLVVHLFFIAFVAFGAFAAVWRPRVAWAHLPCVAWGAWISLKGWICPLTPLENRLRRAGGEAGYSGGFIENYVVPVVYPGDFTRELQMLLGVGAIAVNALVYGWILRRARLKWVRTD